MDGQPSRYAAPAPARAAEGWRIERLTRPSRLHGANGIRTGRDGRIYVAQVAGSQVSALDVATGEIETISPIGGAIVGPDDLAFDEDGNLYVTEITRDQVRMLAPNGTSRVVRGDIAVANPIAFHQGRLIAGELRMGGRIMELDRDGGEPRVIAADVPMANAFDVGPDGKLYFPAQGANEIWRVSLDGGAPEVVARDLGVPDSVKFHPDGSIISTQVISGQVLRIDPRTGARSVLADMTPGLDNVAFVGDRIFVSHIAGSIHEIVDGVARPVVERGLQWPLGVAVGGDGTLFVSDGGFTYAVRSGEAPVLIGMLFTPGFPGWVRDVAAAGTAGEWIVTTANGTVARWNPAAQTQETIASGYDRLMGVAVAPRDAIVVAELPTGRVLSLDGGTVDELAAGLDRPHGVAIADDGTVFVAEAGRGRVVSLVRGKAETVLDGLGLPEGIAVRDGRLYVLDTLAKTVTRCDLDGDDRRVLATDLPVGTPAGMVRQPLGGVGDMCGPMVTMAGIDVGGDGTVYLAGDAEGSVLALRSVDAS